MRFRMFLHEFLPHIINIMKVVPNFSNTFLGKPLIKFKSTTMNYDYLRHRVIHYF